MMLATVGSVFAQGTAESAAPARAGKEKIVWAAYGYLAENKARRIKADFEAKYPQYEVEYVDLGSTDIQS
jgi:ABC-type glycerol-3-phosphate transport system substrate-binding protein